MAANLDDYSLAPPAADGREEYSLPYEASDYHLSGLDPDMRLRFEDMAGEYYNATGQRLKMASGYRSTEHQARLHAADPNSGMVAPAGNSTHEQGKAIDLNRGQIGQLEELGLIDKYFNRPLMGQTKSGIREPWHIEHPDARTDPIFTTRKKGVMERVGDFIGPSSAEAATDNLDHYSLAPPAAANLDHYSLAPPAAAAEPLDATSETLAQFAGVGPDKPKSVMEGQGGAPGIPAGPDKTLLASLQKSINESASWLQKNKDTAGKTQASVDLFNLKVKEHNNLIGVSASLK